MSTKYIKKKTNEKRPNNFHVRFRPGTAEWLRGQVNDGAPSVPAVVKDIVEEKRREAEKSTTGG